MNLETKTLIQKAKSVLFLVKNYVKFIFIIVMLFIISFLVFRINELSKLEPSEDAVTEKLQGVKRPKIDDEVITKIQQLQNQNIEVKSLFDQARSNPFNE